MRNRIHIMLILLILQLGGLNCKEVYNPPAIQNNPHLLVVDGIVINGNDSTVITLSRTRSLSDTVPSEFEKNAQVSVVGASGVEYPLLSEGNGSYIIDQLLLDTTQQYQLKIVTADGNEFRSDLNHVYTSPPIDSLNWSQDADGVHIYVNSHDPTNNSKYYRWQYLTTWEYHSAFLSSAEYIDENTIVPRYLDNQVNTCYKSQASSSIEVATTTQLSSDIISQYEVSFVPTGSEQISAVYSNLVSQYAIPVEAYNFWQNLKRNTEQLGSLFDLQPFTELGNIQCVNNPAVKCIGFISFSTLSQKRIFISKNEVNNWNYSPYYGGDCSITTVPPDSISFYFQPPGGPYFNSLVGGTTNGSYLVSTASCVDCTYHLGTNQKPSFWP
jgi:Domain of unknown function (DUF4249)